MLPVRLHARDIPGDSAPQSGCCSCRLRWSRGTAIYAHAARQCNRRALLVVPQRVPEAFVRSTVTTRIEIGCRRSRADPQ
jgi:hypothetical protein